MVRVRVRRNQAMETVNNHGNFEAPTAKTSMAMATAMYARQSKR
jgi:hypothetical protein